MDIGKVKGVYAVQDADEKIHAGLALLERVAKEFGRDQEREALRTLFIEICEAYRSKRPIWGEKGGSK